MILEAAISFTLSAGIMTLIFKKKSEEKIISEVLEGNKIFIKKGKSVIKPIIEKVERLESFTRYFLRLPNGISSQSVEKASASLSEALNKDVIVSFDYYTLIDVFLEKLPDKIDLDEKGITKDDYVVLMGENIYREKLTYNFDGQFSHLLIAGISGGGKSSIVHSILCQLSLKSIPPDLYISDLKEGVELGMYEGMEHVKAFVTELEDLDMMLSLVMFEMNDRYKQMKRKGLRKWKGKPIVVVMDELIDLKVNGKGDTDKIKELKLKIKNKFTQINSKGRAAKVYTLGATQRPDSEVIDGIIKTNIATTLGFKTRDNTQSYIVMDNSKSAELPYIAGRGYFQQSDDILIQTYYLSEEKEEKLLKDIPRVKKYEQNSNEDRQMDSNIIDITPTGFSYDESDRNVIQFRTKEH